MKDVDRDDVAVFPASRPSAEESETYSVDSSAEKAIPLAWSSNPVAIPISWDDWSP